MQTFRYLPPDTQEQRAFAVQFAGTVLGVMVALGLAWATREAALRAVLTGAAAGTIYLLARAAWQLEAKARRAEKAFIGVADDAFTVADARGAVRHLKWTEISSCEVQGGKLQVTWPRGQCELSARELENGMQCVQQVVQHWRAQHEQAPPSNFIPLSPR